jgi:hypothetical protein
MERKDFMKKRILGIALVLLIVSASVAVAETLKCYDGKTIDVSVEGSSIIVVNTSPTKQTINVIIAWEDGSTSGNKPISITVDAAIVDKNGKLTSTGFKIYDTKKKIARLVMCTL